MIRCLVLGHCFRFDSDGTMMHWICERGCGAGGSKRYRSADDARRYAAAFDRADRADLGRRAPLGLLPLRLARAIGARRTARRTR